MTYPRTQTYEGKPCNRCGNISRYLSTGACVACAKVLAKKRWDAKVAARGPKKPAKRAHGRLPV
jgi:ribosomal protein L37E